MAKHYVNSDRIDEILRDWSVEDDFGRIVFDDYQDLLILIEKLTGLEIMGVED
jgi:hypothetical protein